MGGFRLSKSFGFTLAARGSGGGVTALRREADGTVTIVSLAKPWTPRPTRNPDGTVTVN